MKIAFNTGRVYSNQGQRIAAWTVTVPGGQYILFVDFDRQIDGAIPLLGFGDLTATELKEHVMHMYDHGQYQGGFVVGVYEILRGVAQCGFDAYCTAPDVRVL